MRISAKTEYAVRTLLLLADRCPDMVKLDVLLHHQAMPRKFVEAILAELRRAGLVRSRRGTDGGYALARPADQISIGEVIRIIDGPLAEVHGQRPDQAAGDGVAAHLPQLWVAMIVSLRTVLDGTTLDDVLTGNLPDHVRRLAQARAPRTTAGPGPGPARRAQDRVAPHGG
jgi:Rrf2 family protein